MSADHIIVIGVAILVFFKWIDGKRQKYKLYNQESTAIDRLEKKLTLKPPRFV